MEENNYETGLCVVKSKKREYIFLILVLVISAVCSNVYFNSLQAGKIENNKFTYLSSGEIGNNYEIKNSGEVVNDFVDDVLNDNQNNDLSELENKDLDSENKSEINKTQEEPIKDNENKNQSENVTTTNINYFANNRKLDKNKPMVAITFDDGPHPVITPKLLALLEKYDSRASFFDIGYLMEDYPEIVKAEFDSGSDVGSQAYSHVNLDNLTSNEIKEEISKSNEVFKNITGQNLKYIRAPYGNANSQTRKSIDYPLIHWCVDSEDWKHRDAGKIIEEIEKTENLDGKILIFHAIYDSTYEAMEELIPKLINDGYQLVTVSELAEYKGYNLEKGKIYYQFN